MLRSSELRRRCRAWAAAIALVAPSVEAHDFWLEPTAFAPLPGQSVGVHLKVGEDFVGDAVPRNRLLIDEFVVEDAAGRHSVRGRHGDDPAGVLRVRSSGMLVVGYRGKPNAINLAADMFNHYLREEGLDAVIALRAERGETDAPARELFSRCAKSLLFSGLASKGLGDRLLGFTLELVAEKNPYALRAGQALPLRLMYLGRPLPGARVVAINRSAPGQAVAARSDKAGRVSLMLHREGMWLVKAVHMEQAPADAGADWMSYWASLTFELRAAKVAERQAAPVRRGKNSAHPHPHRRLAAYGQGKITTTSRKKHHEHHAWI